MPVKLVDSSNVLLLEWCGSKTRPAEGSSLSLDYVALDILSPPKLTGIVRGKAFLHVLRRRPIDCPDSRKRAR
ncbi:hypothetical protein TNCV_4374781 [Trichonephila clavipes]|uniref:Uncharacterized protein n=1 Tax=Trichonephila clavipes TaxID=2585209 RepID=A0A8X7BDR4_TRICX|nr:hypothetical protein TNCV_4374781 [Trichonephila clavipes]